MRYFFLVVFIVTLHVYSHAQNRDQKQAIDMVLGVVGNNIILKSDIENQYIQMLSQGYESGKEDMKCRIFEEMLFQKLLVHHAQIDSLEVSEKQVESELDRRISTFISQIGSEEKLEQYYNKSILEIKSEFKEIIRDQMLAQKMQEKITKDVKLTPSDVRRFFNDMNKDSLPTVSSSTEIQQLVVYPQVGEKEKNEVKEKLEALRQRVIKGEKFSTLAVLYSEDPGSAKNGGDLGLVSRNDLVPEFASAAFKLKDPSEVSRIVETDFGYHIIQLIERAGDKIKVRHILISPKVSTDELVASASRIDSLYAALKEGKSNFADVITNFSQDEKSKNNGGLMVNPYTGTTKFEDAHIDPKTKSIIDGLKSGDVSKPFQTTDEKGRQVFKIVAVKSKTAAHQANLKDDYKEIQELAIYTEKQKVIKEWIKGKLENTFVKIDDSYKNCTYMYGNWCKTK